jgi:hypothetical protein
VVFAAEDILFGTPTGAILVEKISARNQPGIRIADDRRPGIGGMGMPSGNKTSDITIASVLVAQVSEARPSPGRTAVKSSPEPAPAWESCQNP